MRQILAGEVRTGRRITQIPASSASWIVRHRGPGSVSVTIPLDADEFRALERTYAGGLFPGDSVFPSPMTYPQESEPLWRPGDGLVPELLAALDPVRCFLAVLEDDTVIEAGPIWSWDMAPGSSSLTVNAGGLASLFDHRLVMGGTTPSSSWSVTYAGLSLGTIGKRLVELAMTQAGGTLPIVLPADVTDEHERTYHGFDLATVGDRLDEIMGVEDGPDIAFTPQLTEDRMGVEWVMRVGGPDLVQAGLDWVFDGAAARGGVAGVGVRRDGSKMATRALVAGEGSDESLMLSAAVPADVGAADLRDVGFPLTETVEDRSTVSRTTTLDRHARSLLRSVLRPEQTWTAQVRTDGSPALGTYRPGDWCQVYVPDAHPLLSLLGRSGSQRVRIMEVRGDMSMIATVTFAPMAEVR